MLKLSQAGAYGDCVLYQNQIVFNKLTLNAQ